MTTRTLAGLTFRAESPSLYEYHGAWLGYDGRHWLVGALGQWGAKEFATRDEAAAVIADAFNNASAFAQ
jgi:hypothetical protein